LNLSVKPGTPGKMLARYTGKALAFGGILAGLQYFDYRRRNGNRLGVIPEMALYGGLSAAALAPKGGSLKKYALVGGIAGAAIGALPTFNKGIFAGVGNLWAGLNLTRSAVSDVLGLTEAVKSQEQYLPGSTKLTTAMGFVGAGALYAGFAQYTRRLALTSRFASRERGLASGTLQAQRFLSLLPSLQANKFANWAHQKNLPKGLTNV
ncbi:hypothetical protein LRR18_16465, partial [Mangrovimonas sp. AS39]|uniref:hypothetical protein n=1 Tax=Mangrovimonas futianensis TaxID=2895523 RepID=UPI001E469BDB